MPTNLFANAVALVALLSSSSSALPQAPNTQPPANLCGNDDRVVLQGTPWLVANSMYGAADMVGTSCTYFDHVEMGAGGEKEVVWRSEVHIQDVEGT